MITEFKKLTIVKIRKPAKKLINKDLQWFCQSLGLFSARDKNSSCFRIFIELLKAAKQHRPISSDELAYRLNLSRGTVVHHLTNLISSGLIVVEKGKYILRVSNLEELIDEIRRDTDNVFLNLKAIARDIDTELGMEKRDYETTEIV
ncbi:helix-turn-helix domain-containing protein [Candidatus Woesearchaeota archaeon]|nr:helix-turn-helix domain-containing protein [Candidatus Woesearchaeota archaeon]